MIISKVILESFGKFHDKALELKDGINLVYGRNESGKSTIHKFIEAIFFGLNEEYTLQKRTSEDYKRFRPWGDHEVYRGSIVYEVDGKKFKVQRDFLKDKEAVNIFDEETGLDCTHEYEYDRVKKERKPLSKIWKLSRLSFLNILGITEVSNKSGRELIKEIQNQIVNVKNTNSNIISVDETLEEIEKAIAELKNLDEIKKVQGFLDQIRAEKEQFICIANEIKEDSKRIFRYKKEILSVKEKEAVVVDQLKVRQREVLRERFEQIKDLNVQIDGLNDEIGTLEIYSNIKASEVEAYIENNKAIEMIQEMIDRKRVELITLQNDLDQLGIHLTKDMMHQITDHEFISNFMQEVEKLLSTKKEKQEVDDSIAQNVEMMDLQGVALEQMDDSTDQNLKIEEDYHKYRDIKTWKDYIAENQNQDEILQHSDAFTKASRKKNLFQDLFNGCSLLIIATAIGAIFLSGWYIFFACLAGAFILFDVILLGFLLKAKQEVNRISFIIKHIQNEEKKNQTILSNNETKIHKLIEKYGCNTEEEFEDLYKNSKALGDNTRIMVKEIKILKTKSESLGFSESTQEGKLTRIIEMQGLADYIHLEDIESAIPAFNDLVKRSNQVLRVQQDIDKIENEIGEQQKEIRNLQSQINESEVCLPKEDFDLEDIQEKIALASQLEEKRSHLIQSKNLLLGDMTEEELEAQFTRPLNEEFTIIPSDDYEYNELASTYYKYKERRGSLNEQMSDLYNQVVLKQSRVRKLSDLNREEAYYQQILKSNEEKIRIHELMLSTVRECIQSIVESFSGDLKNVLDNIIYKITDKYSNIAFDDDMNIFVEENKYHKMVPLEELSAGTIEQIYFALRVSLINVINSQVDIPLILDDCFLEYDSERLSRVMEEISKVDRQVLILTCHEREQQILQKLNLDYNYIEL